MRRRAELYVIGILAALACALVLVWGPASVLRQRAQAKKIDHAIASREIMVSATELAVLMHNRQLPLALFDLRGEADYNWFHLTDAQRIRPGTDDLRIVRQLPEKTVKVLMGAGESSGVDAYRALTLQGTKQVYVLAGGVPAWLDLFGTKGPDGPRTAIASALGSRHAESDPDLDHVTLPKYEAKVKLGAGSAKKGPGGCGS